MTIVEIIDKLRQERELGSRFPSRIIFTEDLSAYSALVTQLKSACDITINLADFGKKDVVPQFDKMRESLAKYEGKQVLLLSVGEYLRMCIKRELNKERAQFPSFWEAMQQEGSRTRYIMPVFACRDSFERIVCKVDERQESFVWDLNQTDPHSAKHYSISVYSPQFAKAISADADNFESWLRYWDVILGREIPCTIITNQYRNAEASFGTINLNPIDSPFAYLCDLIKDADKLDKSWESDDFWAKLIPYLKKDMSFADVALQELGMTAFDFVSAVARWSTLNSLQRELVWMWYRVYPTDGYYSYACKKAKQSAEIPERIRDEILLISSRSQSWINERMKAMQVLGFTSFDDTYFSALDKLPVAEMKLQLLTYKTHEEKAFAVKTISDILRNGAEPEAIANNILKDIYPTLAIYMKGQTGLDQEIDEYLSWYRKHKLINRFPGNYAKSIAFDRFDSRFKQLNKLNGKDCFTFWIDGFGLEWLPVFLKELELRGIIPESKNIATAKLPTETEYNHQWDETDPLCEKWNRLDTFSHKGMPDDKSYYSCIVYQLSVFAEAAKKVDELLNQHEYVAITGDHGSSRLAALSFHDPSIIPVTAPAHSKVRSFGRFCELAGNGSSYVALDFMKKVSLDGKTYVVMKDYNQFSVSGNAAGGNSDEKDVVGEIHGGDTPEERLVPVVVVKRSQPLPATTCKPKSRFVTKRSGHLETTLEFNRKVFSLEVTVDSIAGICYENTDGTWTVSFDGISGEELKLVIVANGNLISTPVTLKVKSYGIEKNVGMGGLP
ncbi:MAG: BREX-4 system phosphatase PglZ [Clostridiales bacterium]|nr:BREX-4 system phosphatase PglZ [Clostridiales bacterium]